MYISVQTKWVQFQQTAVYSFRYFGHFLKKVIEYLTEYTCAGECGRGCGSCRGQSSGHFVPSSLQSDRGDEAEGDDRERPDKSEVAAAAEVLHHRKMCYAVEYDETLCLNGGSCFAIELHNGMRRAGCSCPPNWTGERCEMRYIDPRLWADDEDYIHTAGVRFEVFILVFFCVLIVTSGYLYLRYQKRQLNEKVKSQELIGIKCNSNDKESMENESCSRKTKHVSSYSSLVPQSISCSDDIHNVQRTADDSDSNVMAQPTDVDSCSDSSSSLVVCR